MFDLAVDILVNVTDSEPYIILIIATNVIVVTKASKSSVNFAQVFV